MAKIRLMQPDDAPAVYEIEKQVTYEAWSEKLFCDCIQVGYSCFVLEDKKQVIGFGIISVNVGEAHILNLAIDPKHHGNGYGKKILKKLMLEARRLKADMIYLEVRKSNIIAQKLYEKFNFKEIGERKDYYPVKDGREDAIVLAISLVKI